MKKTAFLILAAVLFAGVSFRSLSFARDVKEMNGNDSQKDEVLPRGMENRGSMGSQAMGMRSMAPTLPGGFMENMMIQQAMKDKSVIATSDGGLIVVVGTKLIKYDKDLNVVKEAEIKIDVEAMRQSMAAMMPNSSMMREGARAATDRPERKVRG